MYDSLIYGLQFALNPSALVANCIGVVLGIGFGVLPGLTSVMGVALLIPMTFGMDPVVAFSALLGMYVGSIYAGSITAILISTPGTPAAAATLLEGPQLREKGKAGKALDITTVASFVGGIFSCVVLIFIAPQLARVALAFGPPEYFSLAIFGMAIVIGLSSGQMLKGFISALIGLFLLTVGIDPITGSVRNTFGCSVLLSGISFVPALVGLFAISQVMDKVLTGQGLISDASVTKKEKRDRLTFKDLKNCAATLLGGSVIGTFIGIIPATGSGTASYVAYNECRRFAREPEKFGTGHLEGLAATESANNAVTGGALVPLLTLGVPGDLVTAILLGGLMIQGLAPGPLLFKENPDIVAGLFMALIIANIVMLIVGLSMARVFARLVVIPMNILMPVIVGLCVFGTYAINNSLFDILTMSLFGLLGFIMMRMKYPLAPLLLAMILSPLVESNFRRAMIMADNDPSIFVTRPISAGVLLLALFVVGKTIYDEKRTYKKKSTG